MRNIWTGMGGMDGIWGMSGRRMYRWKSFWLGVFVLVFFGWAWRWSGLNFRTYQWSRSASEYVDVNVGGGAFGIVKMRAAPVYHSGGLGDDVVWQPQWALFTRDAANAGVLWVVVFPMWFPLACWGVVWSGWLGWRWWRMRRVC